jgi:antitoxin (DNA-binding transcriptional repressor) of toxin-antitoxin stability system
MTMQVLPALEVKSRFGRVSNIVKGGELVTITQHGEPTMVLFPLKLAQEALKAYRTLGKPSNKQDEGDGLLAWLEARTTEPTLTPSFDEQAEKGYFCPNRQIGLFQNCDGILSTSEGDTQISPCKNHLKK